MDRLAWVPDPTNLDNPSPARIYDCLLGGYHNFESDRRTVERLLQSYPDLRMVAAANRAFLRRAVDFLLDQGVDQFLDLGSGLPTLGNVHELVLLRNPAARVVYVDIDPVAVAHSQAMLGDTQNVRAIQGDLCQPEQILADAGVRQLLDLRRPIALVMVAVLHYIVDDAAAYAAVQQLRDAVTPGSYLVISHTAAETLSPSAAGQDAKLRPVSLTRMRPRDQVQAFFGNFVLAEPGLVYTPAWRPEGPDDLWVGQPERAYTWAGVALKAP
jgi:hypothetical protein